MVDSKPAVLAKGFGALIFIICVSIATGIVMLVVGGFAAHAAWACIQAGWDAAPFGS